MLVLKLLACGAAFALFIVVRRAWRKRSLHSIPGPPSASWYSGNFSQWFGHGAVKFHDELAQRYGRVARLNGYLGDQFLVTSDTKAIHEILVKRKDIFEQADYLIEFIAVVMGKGLLGVLGEKHRRQRKLMNPAFSINHMRRMIPIFQDLTMQLQKIMRREIGKEEREVDVLDYMGRLAVELIAQAGLGHSFRALEGEDDGYGLALKSLVPTSARLQAVRTMLPLITHIFPPKFLRFVAECTPWRRLHDIKDIADTLDVSTRKIWEDKKALYAKGDKSVVNEHGEGKDIMSILLKANFEAAEDDRLPDAELLGQMTTFMVAGSDTTSTALSRILTLLAYRPDVQDKLRAELAQADGAKGELGHDELIELPYLEAVCRETLRLYPPVYVVQRDARKDHVVPLANPYTDIHGKQHTDLFIPRGTTVFVDIAGINRDVDIWGPDALEWKPERWLSPLPNSVSEAKIPGVYANTLTFSGGSRACIGFKFSQLEMKVVLSQLIPTFRFAPPEKQEIVWRFGGLVTPSVKGSTANKPELPLRVSLIQ